MACRVVQAAEISLRFRNDLKEIVSRSASKPLLVGYLSNSDPAARKYAEWTERTSRETGIGFELREVPRIQLEEEIEKANSDDAIHGIMVYYPVFGGSQDLYIQSLIAADKDVEGLCHTYRYNLYHNIRFLDEAQTRKCIIPCTPLAIVKVLEFVGAYNPILPYGNRLHGRTITIVNRSEIVGRPLAAMLANDGAKVYSVDINDILEFHRGQGIRLQKHEVAEVKEGQEQILPISDVVITGVPVKGYKVATKLLKEGVIAINFSTFQNFEEDVSTRASIFVPSVGKVTVAMLERNLLRLKEYQESKRALLSPQPAGASS